MASQVSNINHIHPSGTVSSFHHHRFMSGLTPYSLGRSARQRPTIRVLVQQQRSFHLPLQWPAHELHHASEVVWTDPYSWLCWINKITT